MWCLLASARFHHSFFGVAMSHDFLASGTFPLECPADAYAADLARADRSEPFGQSDDSWLVLAQALSRFGELSEEELRVLVPQVADALAASAMSVGLSPASTLLSAARALRGLYDERVSLVTSSDSVTEVIVATQAVAEEMELVGAFNLAYVLLDAALRAFSARLPDRMRGNVMAHQARAARQLGATDVAEELYLAAIDTAVQSESAEVMSRGHCGLAVLASTRGNYPKAREHFERALLHAERASDPSLIRLAHHGLMNSAIVAGDVETALLHGWNMLRLSLAPESRAEALMNMGEVCRLAGEHAAALRVFDVATGWTAQAQVRLHALSGAMQSAVALKQFDRTRSYVDAVQSAIPHVADLYSRAIVSVELADVLEQLGEHALSVARLNAAMQIALENRFHKVIHRAEQLAARQLVVPHADPSVAAKEQCGRPRRSAHFRMVLRSLHGLASVSA
jgi:tetratricopeptide (TPR) repeat protein